MLVENQNCFTTIRIKANDRTRIQNVMTSLNSNSRVGRFSVDDVITIALDSLENKQQEAPFVAAKEA